MQPDLLLLLKEQVRKSPGLTAREYAKTLRAAGLSNAHRSSVNGIFYRNRSIFSKDDSYIPRWFLLQSDRTSKVRPARLSHRSELPDIGIELYAWQKEALTRWKEQNYRGVVEAVTGAGKSLVGIKAAIEQVHRGGFVLIIVPTLELLRQWEKNIKEFFQGVSIGIYGCGSQATFKQCRVIISTVHAARKWEMFPPSTNGLLIADECHRLGSESNKDALDERFDRRLGLSATYQRNDNGTADWLEPYFGRTCFQLGYERALADGVISDFSVALIGVTFSAIEYEDYEKHSGDVFRLRTRLIKEYGLPEEPYGEFMKGVQELIKGRIGKGAIIAGMYNSAFNKRRKLLAESPAKIKALSKLLPAIREANRVLVFTQTIESAEGIAFFLLSNGINARSVHSQTEMQDRRAILLDFGRGKLHALVAPNILNEGVDVPEADLGIIVAGSKTRREMIQRMGRVLRRKKDGRTARFALLFVEGTSEDPSTGAHEDFIDEITSVAKSCRVFSNHASSHAICGYLNKSSDR